MSFFTPFAFVKQPEAGAVGPAYVTANLAVYLDANSSTSYPGSGTTWTDLSPNGNNGTISGPTFVSGTPSYFNFGTTVNNNVVTVADAATLDASSGVTMEVFTVADINTGFSHLITKQAASTWSPPFARYAMRLDMTQAQKKFEAWIQDFTNVKTANITISTGTWKHYVATWNYGGDYKIRFYENGSIISTSTATTATSISDSTFPLLIGNLPGGGFNLKGKLGLTRVYTAALSDSEVLQNFNANKSVYGL